MKNVLVFIFIALITLINADATIKISTPSVNTCEKGLAKVSLEATLEGSTSSQTLNFNMSLVDDGNEEYMAACRVELAGHISSSEDIDVSDLGDGGKTLRILSYNKRKLEFTQVNCEFKPPERSTTLTYKDGSVLITDGSTNSVQVESSFSVSFEICGVTKDPATITNLKLSYGQVNNFVQGNDYSVSFDFYGFTTSTIDINYEIIIYIYMYLEGGIRDNILRKARCLAKNDVSVTEWSLVKAPFQCSISGLTQTYQTFRFNFSDFIAGVPYDNPTLLDPVLTANAITAGTIVDYSLYMKPPIYFFIHSVDTSLSSTQGTFTIAGELTRDLNEEVILRIPLTFPLGLESVCLIPISKANEEIYVQCRFSGIIVNQIFLFEQRLLRNSQFLFGNYESEEPISAIDGELEHSKSLLGLTLSFRQINHFQFVNKVVSFNFYGLTTKSLSKSYSITIYLYLILVDGTFDSTKREATCILDNDVNPTSQGLAQADFICQLTVDTSETYTSFRFSHSDSIAGIPNEETLLDPVKTDEYINNKLLLNYTEEDNKEKLPIMFTPLEIDGSSCQKKGEFKISGTVSESVITKLNFNIPVTYPEEFITQCNIDADSSEINCIIGNKLEDKLLKFEQQIIREGLKELLVIANVESSGNMNCIERNIIMFDHISSDVLSDKESDLLSDSTAKSDLSDISNTDVASWKADDTSSLSDVATGKANDTRSLSDEENEGVDPPEDNPEKKASFTLSFRQLNSFVQEGDTISFYFYGLTTTRIEINFEIIFYIYLYLDGGVKENILRQAKCFAEEAAQPSQWSPVQVPFKCNITGLTKDYQTLKFSASDYIAGVLFGNDTLLDPVLTANAIQEGILLDYSLDENKEKVPNMLIIDQIDTSSSESEGTFDILGKMAGDITQDIQFRIPMTFPVGTESVCTIPISTAQEQITIKCKFSANSMDASLMFEQRILWINQLNCELLFGNYKTNPINIINGEYNYAKYLLDLTLFFRQINKFELVNDVIKFNFFGLTTKTISAGYKITLFLHLLLEGGVLDPALSQAECTVVDAVNPTDGQAQADFSCEVSGFETTNTITSFVLSHSDEVAGIPHEEILLDPVKTDKAIKDKILLDYSLDENKVKLPPLFTPSGIDGSNCEEKGEFKITTSNSIEIESKLQFNIPVTYPEEFMTECSVNAGAVSELKCIIRNKL